MGGNDHSAAYGLCFISCQYPYGIMAVLSLILVTLPYCWDRAYYTYVADYAVHGRLRRCGSSDLDWQAHRRFLLHYGHIFLRLAGREYTKHRIGCYSGCLIIYAISRDALYTA